MPTVLHLLLPSHPLLPPPGLDSTPRLSARWEPGAHVAWAAHTGSATFVATLSGALSVPTSDTAAAELDALLLVACKDLGMGRESRLHNPNQDRKFLAPWFDLECR